MGKSVYTVRKKTVVFGGHDTWRHALNEKVPGIVFAPNSRRINTSLVQNADMIWIQTNAISHPATRTIRNTAKHSGVSVNFFQSGGAERCADQIIEHDGLLI